MKTFTSKEIARLQANKYVSSVSETKIRYSKDFQELFIKEYLKGEKPTEIFRAAGFDVVLLGAKRIERAASRWRKAAGVGVNSRGKQ